MKFVSLALTLGLMGLAAHAAPIHYTIHFTPLSGPTPSGSFDYDATTEAFSNFVIQWAGYTYNVLPPFSSTTNTVIAPPCDTPGSVAADLFAALSGACSAPDHYYQAYVAYSSGSETVAVFNLKDDATFILEQFEQTIGPPILADAVGEGTYSISPAATTIPEPTTLLLMSVGGVLLAWRSRRTLRGPSDPPSD